MGKWTQAAKKVKAENDVNREVADDFRTLLAAIPPGQMKQLLKDRERAAILAKYGITEE
jgi:uncharacterized protein YmfQ (DUF2313 family)